MKWKCWPLSLVSLSLQQINFVFVCWASLDLTSPHCVQFLFILRGMFQLHRVGQDRYVLWKPYLYNYLSTRLQKNIMGQFDFANIVFDWLKIYVRERRINNFIYRLFSQYPVQRGQGLVRALWEDGLDVGFVGSVALCELGGHHPVNTLVLSQHPRHATVLVSRSPPPPLRLLQHGLSGKMSR